MLAHDGWWGGERFMEASWVYRMSHPAHEDANTAYGQYRLACGITDRWRKPNDGRIGCDRQ